MPSGPTASSGDQTPVPSAMASFNERVETTRDARSWLAAFLRNWGIAAPVIADAILVASELVTNALRHGAGAAVVRASIRESVIRLSVTDSGDDLPEQQSIDLGRVGGLGLHVVERVSEDWGVAAFPGGKTVWALIPR